MAKRTKPSVLRTCEQCEETFLADAGEVNRGHARYCSQACWRAAIGTPQQRFERLTRREENGCLVWTGALGHNGYGLFRLDGKQRRAHHVSYEWAYGPIPHGLQADHLCRNRACVEPTHIEAVSPRENLRRSESFIATNIEKTACLRGHEFTQSNTYMRNGRRHCRTCRLENTRERRAKRD